MIRVALEALAGSGRVKEVEEDLGGSWRVLDGSRVYGGSTSVQKVLGRVFNVFGGLLWSG